MQKILLYGAYGYTGHLLAGVARNRGLSLVLSGRDEMKLKEMAAQFEFPYTVIDLSDDSKLRDELDQVEVVIHAAGPFCHTAEIMMKACIQTKTHYLDITGEIGVFELARSLDKDAQEAGIMLMPGVGFDVVPTDCVAAFLKEALPTATSLELAFAPLGKGGPSRGTALTMIESLGEGGAIRKNGEIIKEPLGKRTMKLPFGDKKMFFMSIPWGDVSTAFYTTGIPNIVTYMGISPKQYKWVRKQKYFNWLLRTDLVRKMARNKINQKAPGPSVEDRFGAKTMVWGEVRDDEGNRKQVRILVPNGYDVTADMGINIAQKVADGNWKPGFQTPAGCYGADLVLELGAEWEHPY